MSFFKVDIEWADFFIAVQRDPKMGVVWMMMDDDGWMMMDDDG